MGVPTIYVDTGGAATNSGSSDSNAADLTGSAATVTGSVVFLDGTPNLSAVDTGGSATIALADATNSDQKIFQITAVSDTGDNVTVSVAPTGITSSAWAIGGRFVYTKANINGALAAGWTMVLNNSPASHSGSAWIDAVASGDNANGNITVRAASGASPVVTVTSDNPCIANTSAIHWEINGIEFVCSAAGSSNVLDLDSIRRWSIIDCEISDSPGRGINLRGSAAGTVRGCEISGTADIAIYGESDCLIYGNYIHDLSGDGVYCNSSSGNFTVLFNIIDTISGDGIDLPGGAASGTHTSIINNTIYNTTDSNIEITDTGQHIDMFNNISSEPSDKDVDVERNVAPNLRTGYNIFAKNSFSSNFTPDTGSDITGQDPSFVDAASGDFRVQPGSPARQTGWPGQFKNGGNNIGYIDIGAVQAKATTHFNVDLPPFYGEVPDGDTIAMYLGARGDDGALAISDLGISDIEIFKDGSDTQRSSTSGFGADGDFDSNVGLMRITIDTSDDTDAGFYAVGSFFTVVINGFTIDGVSISVPVGTFRLVAAESVAGLPRVDMAAINGDTGSAEHAKDGWSESIGFTFNRFFEQMYSGNADTGDETSLTYSSGLASDTGIFIGSTVHIVTGNSRRVSRLITGHNGTTGTITFATLPSRIAQDDQFIVVPPFAADISRIHGDTGAADHLERGWGESDMGLAFNRYWDSVLGLSADTGTTTSVTDNNLAGDTGAYVGHTIIFNSGSNNRSSRTIRTHDGTTGTVTFDALPASPSGALFTIIPRQSSDIQAIFGDSGPAFHLREGWRENNIGQVFNRYFDSFLSATSDTGTTTSLTDTTLADDTGFCVGHTVVFNSGPANRRARTIRTHDGVNGIITFDAVPASVGQGSTYCVVPRQSTDIHAILGDTGAVGKLQDAWSEMNGFHFARYWDAFESDSADTGTTTSLTNASQLAEDTGYCVGHTVMFSSGPNDKRSRTIRTHDGANGIITFDALPTKVGDGDIFVIVPRTSADLSSIYGDTGAPTRIRLFADRLNGAGQLDTGTFDSSTDKGFFNGLVDAVWDEADTGHNVAGTMGSRLQGDSGSADAFVDQLLEKTFIDGQKVIEVWRGQASVLLGTVTGAGTGTEKFAELNDTGTPRVTATIDNDGNRTAITYALDT